MRLLAMMLCSGMIIGLAYWAYKENYQTQASIRRVSELQYQIARERTTIAVLKAEWAYQNRPERLRTLVDMNFDDLQLLPLLPENYADVELVAYPSLGIDWNEVKDPVSVRAVDDEEFP